MTATPTTVTTPRMLESAVRVRVGLTSSLINNVANDVLKLITSIVHVDRLVHVLNQFYAVPNWPLLISIELCVDTCLLCL